MESNLPTGEPIWNFSCPFSFEKWREGYTGRRIQLVNWWANRNLSHSFSFEKRREGFTSSQAQLANWRANRNLSCPFLFEKRREGYDGSRDRTRVAARVCRAGNKRMQQGLKVTQAHKSHINALNKSKAFRRGRGQDNNDAGYEP